jgi:hypothetical protein
MVATDSEELVRASLKMLQHASTHLNALPEQPPVFGRRMLSMLVRSTSGQPSVTSALQFLTEPSAS